MPDRLQCSSSSSSEGDEHRNEDEAQLCINGASSAADEGEHTAFMPLAPWLGQMVQSTNLLVRKSQACHRRSAM